MIVCGRVMLKNVNSNGYNDWVSLERCISLLASEEVPLNESALVFVSFSLSRPCSIPFHSRHCIEVCTVKNGLLWILDINTGLNSVCVQMGGWSQGVALLLCRSKLGATSTFKAPQCSPSELVALTSGWFSLSLKAAVSTSVCLYTLDHPPFVSTQLIMALVSRQPTRSLWLTYHVHH